MTILCPPIRIQQFDANGDPAVGYKLYTYVTGTTTPKATYIDSGGVTPNTNPIILDARGEATIFLAADAYRLVLKTGADVTVWTQDGVSALSAADGITITNGAVSLSSSVAGDGLTYTAGVLAVGATDASVTVAANGVKVNLGHTNEWAIIQNFGFGINATSLKFGSTGATLTKAISVDDARDLASIASQSSTSFSVTVTGAAAGDHVVITPTGPYATNASLFFKGVASLNAVDVYVFNAGSGAVDPASATIKILVVRTT